MKRREIDFRSFHEVKEEIDRLHRDGYERAGAWNLGQICDHLGRTMEAALQEKSLGLPRPLQFVLKAFFLNQILRSRRMKSGVRTANDLLPDQSEMGDQKQVDDFRKVIDRFTTFTGTYCRNPAFGNLTRSRWQELQLIHCSHHLSFLIPKATSAQRE